MNVSATKLMKFWISVVLCFGALSDALGAEASSNPPEVSRGHQGSPPSSSAAAPSPPDYSTLYGSLFYPHDEHPFGLERDGSQPFGNYEEEGDENDVYPDQEEDLEETGRALMVPRDDDGEGTEQQLKRSMGMLRLGRRSSPVDKRPRTMAALRLGRRSEVPEAVWRKRSMGMLRLGRSEEAEDEEEDEEEEKKKRSMGILRLGRRSRPLGAEEDKRSMGMLRLGRSQGIRRQSLGR